MTQSNEEDEGVAESITLVADMNEHKHTLLLFPPLNSNRFSPSVAYIIHMSCTIRTTAVCLGKHSPIYTLQSLHPPLSTCLSQPLTLGEQRQTHVNNCMEVAEGKSGQRTEREWTESSLWVYNRDVFSSYAFIVWSLMWLASASQERCQENSAIHEIIDPMAFSG